MNRFQKPVAEATQRIEERSTTEAQTQIENGVVELEIEDEIPEPIRARP